MLSSGVKMDARRDALAHRFIARTADETRAREWGVIKLQERRGLYEGAHVPRTGDLRVTTMTRNAVVVAGMLVCVGYGWAQQISPAKNPFPDPCAAAADLGELRRCTPEAYRRSDKRLEELYGRISMSLQKSIATARAGNDELLIRYNTTALDNLRSAQQAWLAYRDLHCRAAEKLYEGGSLARIIFAKCMWQATDHRIEELEDAYGELVR
jgi:uncharacterized protein YecT (DUF1311 family)